MILHLVKSYYYTVSFSGNIIIHFSDNSNLHHLAVSLQSFQDHHQPVWQHYKLIQLGSDTSGLAQATAIIEQFKADGEDFFNLIKKNVVAIVTDGAANMYLGLSSTPNQIIRLQ